MHVGRITGMTRNLGAPPDWDAGKHGQCGHLPVRDEMTTAGQAMTSAWFSTVEELERLVRGAPIYLTVLGSVHPPVDVRVGQVPKETEEVV